MGNAAQTDDAPKSSFFKGVKKEFKKITWVDKKTLFKQSISVIIASIVVGMIISVLDFIIQYGIDILVSIGL